MIRDFHPIFYKYNTQLKPLTSEIEGRLEQFCQPLLLNLASVFDYLSISVAEKQDEETILAEADRCMDACISECYMSLIYAIRQDTDKFEKIVGKHGIQNLGGGHFVGPYVQLRDDRNRLLIEAEDLDEVVALPKLKSAYEKASEMEKLMNQEKPNICFVQSESSSRILTLIKWILSIAISVLVGIMVNYCLNKIWI